MKSQSPTVWRGALERHPLVLSYDSDGGPVTVTTVKGFAFGDGGHTRTFETTRDALLRLKWADPCRCPRCTD